MGGNRLLLAGNIQRLSSAWNISAFPFMLSFRQVFGRGKPALKGLLRGIVRVQDERNCFSIWNLRSNTCVFYGCSVSTIMAGRGIFKPPCSSIPRSRFLYSEQQWRSSVCWLLLNLAGLHYCRQDLTTYSYGFTVLVISITQLACWLYISVRSSTDKALFEETKRFLQCLVSQNIAISEAVLQTELSLKSMGVLSE